MSYSWKILKSAVEQEILFPSEEVYENYLAKYEKEPYEIVEETEREDGTYIAVIRKKYHDDLFLRRREEIPDEEFEKFMKKLFQIETELTQEHVQVPPELHDNVMNEIKRREERKGR